MRQMRKISSIGREFQQPLHSRDIEKDRLVVSNMFLMWLRGISYLLKCLNYSIQKNTQDHKWY